MAVASTVAPPTSSRLSVSSCRDTLQRPAPSAARTASSRHRSYWRIRSIPQTLAVEISTTKLTAPISRNNGERTSPISGSRIGDTVNETSTLSGK